MMRSYTLDSSDVICRISGDWQGFSEQNGGGAQDTSAVLGTILWDSVAGKSTFGFLEQMIYDLRKAQTAISMLYRCDSPEMERVCHMKAEPVRRDGLEITHKLVRARPHRVVPLRDMPHLTYRKCSQCLSCNFGGPWVSHLHFRLSDQAVAIDAVCPTCKASAHLSNAMANVPGLDEGAQRLGLIVGAEGCNSPQWS